MDKAKDDHLHTAEGGNSGWKIAGRKTKRLQRQHEKAIEKQRQERFMYTSVGNDCWQLVLSFLTIHELSKTMLVSKHIRFLSRCARKRTRRVIYDGDVVALPRRKFFRKISSWCTTLTTFQNRNHPITFRDLRRIVLGCKNLETFRPGGIKCVDRDEGREGRRLCCSDNIVSLAAGHLPHLSELHVSGCIRLSELNSLKRCKKLRVLRIGVLPYHDERARYAEELSEVLNVSSHLEYLVIKFNRVSSDVITRSNVLPRLKGLYVYDDFFPEKTKRCLIESDQFVALQIRGFSDSSMPEYRVWKHVVNDRHFWSTAVQLL